MADLEIASSGKSLTVVTEDHLEAQPHSASSKAGLNQLLDAVGQASGLDFHSAQVHYNSQTPSSLSGFQDKHAWARVQPLPTELAIEEAGRASGLNLHSSAVPPGSLAPSSFKADARSRHLKSSESSSRFSPSKQTRNGTGQKIQLPPIRTLSASASPSMTSSPSAAMSDYQSNHHSLIPKKRGPSAYAKKHYLSHQPLIPAIEGMADGGAPSHVRTAVIKALAMNAELRPGPAANDQIEAMQSQWRNTSIGDLEALDSILDQLVIADDKMREALLRGPSISFETVIHEPMQGAVYKVEDADQTFITSVGMEGRLEEDATEEEPLASEQPKEPSPSLPLAPVPQLPKNIESQPPPNVVQTTALALTGGSWNADEGHEVGSRDRERMNPIPILPNLSRMYVTTRQSMLRTTPPLPPPTAEYLLNHRPSIASAAPSYDELCDQIKGVQRQYTCGSSKADGGGARHPSPIRSNLDMYISGLDGPSLDQIVQYEESINMERTRPTFVAMAKTKQAAKLKTAKFGMNSKSEESVHHHHALDSFEIVGGGAQGDD